MSPHSPIAPDSPTRVAPASQPPESHGRTDGRTDEDPNNVGDILAVSNVRGGVERFPVVRFGPRDEIPRDLRYGLDALWSQVAAHKAEHDRMTTPVAAPKARRTTREERE